MPNRPTTRLPNSMKACPPLAGSIVSPQFGQSWQPSPDPVRRTKAPETTTTPSIASDTTDSWKKRCGDTWRRETSATARV